MIIGKGVWTHTQIILVTRLHDMIYHPKDALVIPKDPKEYLQILEWHQKNPEIMCFLRGHVEKVTRKWKLQIHRQLHYIWN